MRYLLVGLDCPNCAARIERELQKAKGLEKIRVNFNTSSIELPGNLVEEARKILARIEPGIIMEAADGSGSPDPAGEPNVPEKTGLIIIAALLFLFGTVFNRILHDTPYSWAEYAVLLSAYFLVGGPVIGTAARKILRGQYFDENFLMTLATAGAIAIHQLPEAAGVMLFYAIGEYLQGRAVQNSHRSITALLKIQPEYANLSDNGGASGQTGAGRG